MTELCDLEAVELRRLIGQREISPVELLDSCLARIDAVNPTLNAITATCYDRARAEAEAAERAVREGQPLGALHGLPVGIKDLQETEGLKTTFGSPLYADYVPARDERTVAAVRAAGGIVVGKTNVPEFGAGGNSTNPVYGATGNPFDAARTCGGSSGGSAAALATGMVPVATGSDTGGSLRLPAAFCGIVGLRPSPGLVPSERRPFGWAPISVLGPMGRTVADTALLMSAMAASDDRDPLSGTLAANDSFFPLPPADLSGLRVAVSADLGFAPVDSGIRESFNAAVARFSGVFGAVDVVDPPLGDADEIFDVQRAMQFVASHAGRPAEQQAKLGPNIRANVAQGLAMSVAQVARAQAAHSALYRRFLAFMADYDLLICPTVSVPPFPHSQLYVDTIDGKPARTYFHWLALTYGLTLTAHPVISLPCGLDPTGAPLGIQLTGKRGGDRRLLALAAALEAHLKTLPGLGRPLPDLKALAS